MFRVGGFKAEAYIFILYTRKRIGLGLGFRIWDDQDPTNPHHISSVQIAKTKAYSILYLFVN